MKNPILILALFSAELFSLALDSKATPQDRRTVARSVKDKYVELTGDEKAMIETNKGSFVITLYSEDAPNTVRNFIRLAECGFYDGLIWHRYVPNFVIQGGDPFGTGKGDAGYTINYEESSKSHEKGAVGMARGVALNSASSQFYICLEPMPDLDGSYCVFGKVIEGIEIVGKLRANDTIRRVYILIPLTAGTSSSPPPQLSFTSQTSDTDSDSEFEGGEQVSISVTVTNSGKGKAEEVTAELSGDAELITRFGSKLYFGDIETGKSVTRQATATLPYDIEARTAQIDVRVSESSLGRLPDVQRIQVACMPAREQVTITEVSTLIPVDVVPVARQPDPNAYGVVIGISKYREGNIPDITYAENDAKIVAQYFSNVLGVPSHQLYTFYDDDATRGDFEDLLKRILPNATQGGKVLYFYYAGHGTPIPDKSGNGRPYLVPYNGQLGSQYKLYSLDSLYSALGELPVDNVLVFVDACFSGTGRSALASGQRPAVMTEMETETWPAKLRVIAAAKSTETAWDYEDAKHGLFTYYLLDGLRGAGDTDSDGYIEFGELYNYIHSNVLSTSTKTLLKRQEPVALPEGGRGVFKIVKVR